MASAPAGPGAGALSAVTVYYGMPMQLDVSRVLACLYEKDVPFTPVQQSVSADLIKLQASTRAHTVGFEDGPIFLHDSRAICRYVSEKYANRGNKYLLGRDLLERASIEQWLKTEEQSFDPPSWNLILYIAFPPHTNSSGPDRAPITQSERKLAKVLDVYEQRLSQSRYLAGEEFTLADLTHLPNSYYLANSDRWAYLFDSRMNVKRWWEAISDRPSWTKVVELMTNKVEVSTEDPHAAAEIDVRKSHQPLIEVKKDVASSRQKSERFSFLPAPTLSASWVSPTTETARPPSDAPQDVAPATQPSPATQTTDRVVPAAPQARPATEAAATPSKLEGAKSRQQDVAEQAGARQEEMPSPAPIPSSAKVSPSLSAEEDTVTEAAKFISQVKKDVASSGQKPVQISFAPPPTQMVAQVSPSTEAARPPFDTPRDVAPSPTTPEKAKAPVSEQAAGVVPLTKETATPSEAAAEPALEAQKPKPTPQAAAARPADQVVPATPRAQPAATEAATTPSKLEGAKSRQQDVAEQAGARQEVMPSPAPIPSSASDARDTSETAKVSPSLSAEKGALPDQSAAEAAKSRSISQKSERFIETEHERFTTQASEKPMLVDKTTGQEVRKATEESQTPASTADKSTEPTSSSQRTTTTESTADTTTVQDQARDKSAPPPTSPPTAKSEAAPQPTAEKKQPSDQTVVKPDPKAPVDSKEPGSSDTQSNTQAADNSKSNRAVLTAGETATGQASVQTKEATGSVAASQTFKSSSVADKPVAREAKEADDKSTKSAPTTEKTITETTVSSQKTTGTESSDDTTTDKSTTTEKTTSSQMTTKTVSTDDTTTKQTRARDKSTTPPPPPPPPTDESEAKSPAVSQSIAEKQPSDQKVGKPPPKEPVDPKEPASSTTQSSTQITSNSTAAPSKGKLSNHKTSTSEMPNESVSTDEAEKGVAQSVEPASSTGKSSPKTTTPPGMTGQTPSVSETAGQEAKAPAQSGTQSAKTTEATEQTQSAKTTEATEQSAQPPKSANRISEPDARTQSGVADTTGSTQSPNSADVGAKPGPSIDSNSKPDSPP